MGYKRPVKRFRLVFDTEAMPDMNGLEVIARSVPLGVFMDVTGLDGSAEKRGAKVVELFAGCLVEWNLEEEDGSPVPATLEGLKSQEMGFVAEITKAWMNAIAGVSPPLNGSSPGGAPSLEASLDLAKFSGSLPG